jgi:signal peptidase
MNLPEIFKRDYVQTMVMIFIAIIVVLIFWYGLSFIYGTGNPILAVASESMEPILYKGDLILIEGIKSPDSIQVGTKDSNQPGDIIVFHEPNDPDDLIVHRAVEKIENGDGTYSFKTWGDNNIARDWWEVPESSIVGKYLDIKIPWIGNIALFFVPIEVKIAFVTLWIIVLVIMEITPSLRKKKKTNEN